MKRVTQYTKRETMSFGSTLIKDYYDDILNEEYPEWLYMKYSELPRVQYIQEEQKNNPVQVASVGNNTEDAEKYIWIITELEGEWCSDLRIIYYFELEIDAVAFKLRWG